MKKTIVVLGACLVSLACQQGQQGATPQNPNGAANVGEQYVITSFTTLRLAPSNDKMTQHPQTNQLMTTNWVGVLRRGMKVTVTAMTPSWFKVIVDNGGQGWVSTDNLLNVKKIQLATVLSPTPGYPIASTTTQPAGIIQPGDLLFILQTQGDMTQVQAEASGVSWVVTAALNQDPVEVGMANLIVEAKEASMRRDLDEASEALDEARMKYPTSQLMDVVADQVSISRMHGSPHIPTQYFVPGQSHAYSQPTMLGLPAGAGGTETAAAPAGPGGMQPVAAPAPGVAPPGNGTANPTATAEEQ